jgi:hypothetical protein
MNIKEKLIKELEETYQFYSNSYENREKGGVLKTVGNHSFLIYASIFNKFWKPAYYGSAIISLFDKGKFNNEKFILMGVTFPALAMAHLYFGAFWSKLGTKELLAKSWRERVNKKQLAEF